MASSPSRAFKLFGTEEPVAETRTLRAGPLEAVLEGGNLRHLRLHGREAIRGIGYIVRDRNWGTCAPRLSGLSVEQNADGFRVGYQALCEAPGQTFAYRARIEANPRGGLVFEVEGEAVSDFVTNRAGFVVLHGVEGVSGTPVEVEHVDGRIERCRFPELIDPACPLKDIRALSHEVLPGLGVTCRMEGDAFEMEDQRNWTDASYKTYVRPLARPWPYTIPQGALFTQRVTLEVAGVAAIPPARAQAATRVWIEAGAGRAMPAVGLAAPAAHLDTALQQVALLRALGPAFLMAEVDGRQDQGADLLRRHGALARDLASDLVLEAVLPCVDQQGRPTADLAVLRQDLARLRQAVDGAGARPARLAVAAACDLQSCQPDGPWPPAPGWAELIAATREAFPGIPVGGGSFGYFTELNRKRPPPGLLDFIGHGSCPIVHAADDVSLMESLEALPSVFASTAAFAGGAPYWLFPTAISMRANPYGPAPAANPANVRLPMAQADPRERGLVGAAWYAGYLAHAARAGLAAVTLGAVAGPSGVVGAPSFHVLRGHAALRGATVLPTRVEAPREVQALAARLPDGRVQIWLVNLTGSKQAVEVVDLPVGPGRLALLDEAAFERLGRDPAALEAGEHAVDGGILSLPAYAVARLTVGRPA